MTSGIFCFMLLMKRLLLLSFLLFVVHANAFSQLHYITGTVKDESGKPLSGVEVFLSGTSRLTLTDDDGTFNISRLSAGNYELVAKLLGRETYHASFTLTKSSKFNITLLLNARRLREVVIQSEKPAIVRKAEYAMFQRAFLGQTPNSSHCKILNPEVLNIYTDPETKALHVDSGGEFLEISNAALGYHIRYLLEEFIIDTRKGYSYYVGQIHFQDMDGSPNKAKDWQAARRIAYAGSPQHLLKAIYDNQVAEEGFQMRSLTKVPNKESISESMYMEKRRRLDSLLAAKALSRNQYNDSIGTLGARVHLAAYKQILSDQTISASSVVGRMDGPNKELNLTGELYIQYKKERTAWNYNLPHQLRSLKKSDREGQISLISVREAAPMVDALGNLTNPLSLLYTGYLGWERVADMLPKDYMYKP